MRKPRQPCEEEHKYNELVVLDRAGRIHIPHEYLDQFHIKGHAQLEITEAGILIRQAENSQTEQIRLRWKRAAFSATPAQGTGGGSTENREQRAASGGSGGTRASELRQWHDAGSLK